MQAYYDRTNRYEPNLGEQRNTFDVDLISLLPVAGGRQQITWGLGGRWSHANDLEAVSGLTFRPNQRTDNLYSAFLQDEIGLLEQRLSLVLGTKLLKTNFTGEELEPSARLLWTPSESQTVWAAFTHAVRTPSDAEENFFLSGFVGITPSGIPEMARFNANARFAPEQLNGYELGYRKFVGGKVLVDVASFYNHYHNLFDQEITGPVFLEQSPPPPHFLLPAQFRNGLLGTTKGVEVAPEWRPAENWRLRGTYSYLYMTLTKAPHSGDIGTAPGIVGASPQHQATVGASGDLSKRVELDLTYRYVSELPAQVVPAYSTGDVRVGWRFKREWEISLNGQSLFQPHHGEYRGDPGPLVGVRRSAYVTLIWGR